MTKRMPPAPIIGGPLDGGSVPPATKWPLYLDDRGERLAVFKGDRVFGNREHNGAPRTCYIKRVDFPSGAVRYVHSTAYESQ